MDKRAKKIEAFKRILGAWPQDQILLRAKLKKAIVSQLEAMEDVYGYCLYTCNGFPHVQGVFNTTDFLEEHLKQMSKEEWSFYQYLPDEWASGWESNCFDYFNEALEHYHQRFSEFYADYDELVRYDPVIKNYWDVNTRKFVDLGIEVLKELKEEKYFEFLSEKFQPIVLLYFSDSSEEETDYTKASVLALNDASCYENFLQNI